MNKDSDGDRLRPHAALEPASDGHRVGVVGLGEDADDGPPSSTSAVMMPAPPSRDRVSKASAGDSTRGTSRVGMSQIRVTV